ncbi:transglycosylase SLT domain-containing protein [Thiospirochaeta perfilievii]|nr:transglycosylase SLT domain-containing protein [Thiospirochaeta perfilievii]
MIKFSSLKHTLILTLLFILVGCKTDHIKKKDVEYLFWNASLKTENSFIKEAVKELNDEKGETLIVNRYNSPQTQEEVIDFFTGYTGNRDIAQAILKYSIKYDVPPSLAFALSKAESSFNPKAINRNSTSIDRGLFQLNSTTFSDLTLEEFFDIDTNSAKGIKFIRWCLDTGKNEVSALAMYNAGSGRVSGRGTPKMTLDYISKVLDYRGVLLDEFNLEMSSFARINPKSVKLVKDVTLPLD